MNYLGIDVGGSSIKYALIDESGIILEKDQVPTPYLDFQTYCDTLKSIYIKYLRKVNGVAFSMPGRINVEKGYIHTGGALDDFVHEVNMKEKLAEFIDVPFIIANDAKCAAYAEIGFGSLQNYQNAATFIIGTGVGGALIYKKEVIQGAHYFAGEFSFVKMEISDKDNFKNWQANKCSVGALIHNVKKYYHTQDKLNGKIIFDLAAQNNQKVLQGLKDYCQDVAYTLYNLQSIFDPEVIAIGGGISVQPLLFEMIQKEIDETKLIYDMPRPCIIPCEFRNDANIIGALYLLKQYINKNEN